MIGRRSLLVSAASVLGVGAAEQANATEQVETIMLWPGTPPGGGGPEGALHVTPKGAVDHIARPCLRVYRPAKPCGVAMLVAGGGGYKHIGLRREALPAAQWLNAHGITAFVLLYRLPREGWAAGPRAPLQDAQRAVRLIRARAKQDGLDAEQIGVLGFSAGGHLMGLTADWSDFQAYQPVDSADSLSARPDNAALIYPVITLQPPYQHTSTRRQMVGMHPTPQMSAEWSVQTHVRPTCPPVFMVQAKDDPISNPANTLIMQQACVHEGVPVTLYQPASGGHGFGMGKSGTPTAHWPDWYAAWLARQGVINF